MTAAADIDLVQDTDRGADPSDVQSAVQSVVRGAVRSVETDRTGTTTPVPAALPAGRVHRARIRPAPRRAPAFDDELPGRHLSLVTATHPTLPFDDLLDGPFDHPNPSRLVTELDPFAARPTSRLALPDPAAFGRTLVQAVLEVLAGRRSGGQLSRMVSPAVQAGLLRDHGRRGEHMANAPVVRSVHVCEPADGVAELSVVVSTGRRARAVAARIEGLDGRWRCVRLQIG